MSALRATLVRNSLTGPDGKFLLSMIVLACALVLLLAALSYAGPRHNLHQWIAEAPQSLEQAPQAPRSHIV